MADLILSDCIGLPRHLAVGRADVAMRREFDSTKNCLYKSFFIPKSRLPEFESQLKPGQILLIYDDSPDYTKVIVLMIIVSVVVNNKFYLSRIYFKAPWYIVVYIMIY